MGQNEYYAHRKTQKTRLSKWENKSGIYDISERPDYRNPGNISIEGSSISPDSQGIDLADYFDTREAEQSNTSNNPTVSASIPRKHSVLMHTLLRHLFDIHDKVLPHGDNSAILTIIHSPQTTNQELTSSLDDKKSKFPFAEVTHNLNSRENLINSLADSFGVFLQHHIESKDSPQARVYSDALEDFPEEIKSLQLENNSNLEGVHPIVRHHVANLKGYLKSLLKTKNIEDVNFDKYNERNGLTNLTPLLTSLLAGEK